MTPARLRWTVRLGYCLLAIGLVLVSPLPDLLPVDFWAWVLNGLRHPSGVMFRVVPSDDDYASVWESAMIVAGACLVWLGKRQRRH